MLTKWWKLELIVATNFGSHAQMATKFGGQILATKFVFVPDCSFIMTCISDVILNGYLKIQAELYVLTVQTWVQGSRNPSSWMLSSLEHAAWIRRFGVQVPPGTLGWDIFCLKNFSFLLKNISLSVDDEICCWYTFDILMGWCKKDVTPLLMHLSYIFLALTHRYEMCPSQPKISCVDNTIPADNLVMQGTRASATMILT